MADDPTKTDNEDHPERRKRVKEIDDEYKRLVEVANVRELIDIEDRRLRHERLKWAIEIEDKYSVPLSESLMQERSDRHEEHLHLLDYRTRHIEAIERLAVSAERESNAFIRIAAALERLAARPEIPDGG